ncbi:hypothetical protein HMPREF1044_1826 [Streptococcus constellatus subsp. constellatus SK53]|uniref:Uncharacterized protein n=2 Tax=Streptococcus constellatus TaxID=76860 RepID=F9PAM5_STRCV|nr:hypothetical protein HMPREF1042_2282 [Streptococcus constellatus subsp. pharyngis SK1060 = CCUG 46377]EID19897.1 hypothetical protein HMPREF1044_1826 [Streptococcus constellatus subsp. constellatus SK53]BBD21887.1 hypothetical protein SCSC_0201 [Streptococcus constellatus subsp. constellatus]
MIAHILLFSSNKRNHKMNRLENVEFVNAVLGEFPDWIDLK